MDVSHLIYARSRVSAARPEPAALYGTRTGQTALHLACSVGSRAAAERLLAAGADATELDSRGMSPCDCANRAGARLLPSQYLAQ